MSQNKTYINIFKREVRHRRMQKNGNRNLTPTSKKLWSLKSFFSKSDPVLAGSGFSNRSEQVLC